ncbi:hypothetical protein, conserved, partial [Eimeria tenella]
GKQKAALSSAQQQQQQQQQQIVGVGMEDIDAAGIASWDTIPAHAKEAFWGLLQPRLAKAFAAAVAACQASVLQQQQQKAAAEGELLQQRYELLCLGLKALEEQQQQQQQKPSPLAAYLFKSLVFEIIDKLIVTAFRHAN